MATKQFNRTVEAINELLDKLDGLPTFPLVYRGEVLEYTDLPEEPVQGDCYLVSFETGTDHVSNKLYYYSGTVWKEIAVDGYTKYEIDQMFDSIGGGLHWKGAVSYYSNLPSDAELGDMWTVLYEGTSGSEACGDEYAWGTLNGTEQWILIGKETYSKTQIDAMVDGLTDRIAIDENNISFVASRGGKNVLKFDSVGGGAYSGITYTVNDDGTIRASGTANASSYAYLRINNSNLDAKKYTNGQFVLSGCPSGGGSDTYSLYAARGNYAKFDYGDGVTLTPTSETEVSIVIRVEKGQTVDIVFKPMIRLVGTDSTFEPYAPTNAELTAKVKPLEVQIISSVLTEQAAESYADGTVCGYSGSFASLSGTWLIIRTYTVNADGNRKVQIVESNVGERKTRFFNGSWGSWT